MNPELLHYEIAVSSNRARKDLNSWTSEVKRSSKMQQQAEEAAAHAKEQAARRAAKIKAQLSKLEAKQAKGAHAGEAADHRLRMRALQAELRATTDKTRVLRDVGRARDVEHAKTMRQIRAESAELAKKNQTANMALARRGLHLDPDVVQTGGVRAAVGAARRERFRGKMNAAAGVGARMGANAAAGVGYGVLGYGSLGGGLAVMSAVHQQSAVASGSAGLANQGYTDDGGVTRDQLFKQVQDASSQVNLRYGVDQNEAIRGMTSFVDKTGDVKMAIKLSDFIAKLSSASETDIGELGTVLGNAYSNLKQTKGIAPEDALRQSMELARIFAGQGKIGAVEMRDLASRAPILTASASRFGGDKMKNMSTMGALAQIAVDRGGAPSAEVAATSIKNVALDILKKGKHVGFTGNIEKMDPVDAITKILELTKGNNQKMLKVFGTETLPAVEGLRKVFNEAGGGKEGTKAVRKEIGRYTSAAYSESEMNESAAFRSSRMDRQTGRAMGQFNAAVGSQLVPAITPLISSVAQIAPAAADFAATAADFVSWGMNDPFAGLSAIFAASIAKQAAGVGLAKIFESKLGSAVGAGGMAIGAIYGTIQLAEFAVQQMTQEARGRYDKDAERLEELSGKARAEMDAGQLSPETVERMNRSRRLLLGRKGAAERYQQAQEENTPLHNWALDVDATLRSGINTANTFVRGKDAAPIYDYDGEDRAQTRVDAEKLPEINQRIEQFNAALRSDKAAFEKLTEALRENTQALASSGAGAGGRDRSGRPMAAED